MTPIAKDTELPCVDIHILMAIQTLTGGSLQIGNTGSDWMANLTVYIDMSFLKWEASLLMIEVGTESVDSIVASETI